MALTERSLPHQIIIDFPTAEGFNVRYRERVEILRDGEVINQSVSEPHPAVPAGEQIPEALAGIFGEIAGPIVQAAHEAAVEHEARLQEVADLRARAEAAEQLAASEKARADSAEARLLAAQQALAEPTP